MTGRSCERGWTRAVVAATVGVAMLAGASRTPAASFVFRVILGDSLASFVSTVELKADKRAHRDPDEKTHTLSVTKAFTGDGGIGTAAIGQQFDSATLQIFDGAGVLLETYRLSSVEVTGVRLAGDAETATQTVTLSFRTLAVGIP